MHVHVSLSILESFILQGGTCSVPWPFPPQSQKHENVDAQSNQSDVNLKTPKDFSSCPSSAEFAAMRLVNEKRPADSSAK